MKYLLVQGSATPIIYLVGPLTDEKAEEEYNTYKEKFSCMLVNEPVILRFPRSSAMLVELRDWESWQSP